MQYEVIVSGNVRYNKVDYASGESVLVDERGLYELQAHNLVASHTEKAAPKRNVKKPAKEETQESGE